MTAHTLRLSEAIRLGALLGPQLTGRTHGPDDGSCALGAALRAIGIADRDYGYATDHWAILSEIVTHPVTGMRLRALTVVRQLNDTHDWTRERIAEWVATIEPQADVTLIEAEAIPVHA